MSIPRSTNSSPGSDARSSPGSLVLAVDLGATKVVSALVSEEGTVVQHGGRHLHGNDGPDAVIEALLRVARLSMDANPAPPEAVGISVAAQVDPATGYVLHAPNLRWRNVPLGPRVSAALGLPVHVTNDARAATVAEWRLGAGRGESDLFCLILGTGVGGSAVAGGRLLEGGTSAAGEVGHLTIVSGGRPCHCPNRGCFEAYVGGWGIAEQAQEAVRQLGDRTSILKERAGSIEAITARTVFESARAGDTLSRRLVEQTEQHLADGAVSVVNAFNPRRLILGGGLVAGHPEFVMVAARAVRERCQPPAAAASVVPARFGEEAPLIGAAVRARELERG
jgi:glucokinase